MPTRPGFDGPSFAHDALQKSAIELPLPLRIAEVVVSVADQQYSGEQLPDPVPLGDMPRVVGGEDGRAVQGLVHTVAIPVRRHANLAHIVEEHDVELRDVAEEDAVVAPGDPFRPALAAGVPRRPGRDVHLPGRSVFARVLNLLLRGVQQPPVSGVELCLYVQRCGVIRIIQGLVENGVLPDENLRIDRLEGLDDFPHRQGRSRGVAVLPAPVEAENHHVQLRHRGLIGGALVVLRADVHAHQPGKGCGCSVPGRARAARHRRAPATGCDGRTAGRDKE